MRIDFFSQYLVILGIRIKIRGNSHDWHISGLPLKVIGVANHRPEVKLDKNASQSKTHFQMMSHHKSGPFETLRCPSDLDATLLGLLLLI